MNAALDSESRAAPIATGPVPVPASYWELYGPDAPEVWRMQRNRARDGLVRLTALCGGDGVGEGSGQRGWRSAERPTAP